MYLACSLLTIGQPYFSMTCLKVSFGLIHMTLSTDLTCSLTSGYSSPVSQKTAWIFSQYFVVLAKCNRTELSFPPLKET